MDWNIYVARDRAHWEYLRRELKLDPSGRDAQAGLMVILPLGQVLGLRACAIILSVELNDRFRNLPAEPTTLQKAEHEWWVGCMLTRLNVDGRLIVI